MKNSLVLAFMCAVAPFAIHAESPQLLDVKDLLQLQTDATSWATNTVKAAGKDSIVIAQFLLNSHAFSIIDNQIRKQLPELIALTSIIRNNALEYQNSDEAITLLVKQLGAHKVLTATCHQKMEDWKKCQDTIEKLKSETVNKAIDDMQTQMQEVIKAHLKFVHTKLNEKLSENNKALEQLTQNVHEISQICALLNQDKIPVELKDPSDLLSYKAHFINELATALQAQGLDAGMLAHMLQETVISMQDVTTMIFVMYYKALYSALKKSGFAQDLPESL